MSYSNIYCLDPSCFSSLNTLRDTVKVLHHEHPITSRIIILTDVYNTIMLEPDDKFRALPQVIGDWINRQDPTNIVNLDRGGKREYVAKTRELLSEFNPSPAGQYVSNMEKIGQQSIFRSNVIETLGKVRGKIVFEMLALSDELPAKIIGFGRVTASLMKSFGSSVMEAKSTYKATIKEKLGIRNALVIMAFVMGMDKFHDFTKDLQVPGIPLSVPDTVGLGMMGLLVVGNG